MTTASTPTRRLTSDQRSAFAASLLGWMMDAFDYFIVVLVYADIAAEFHVTLEQIAFLTTITLVMRPVGAYLFGLWADRVGRRIPLIVDVCFYSFVGFLCAFAPNFTVLFILVPRLDMARHAPVMNMEPVATLLFAWVVLGQWISPLQMVGGLVVLSGIVLLSRIR